MPEGLPSNLNSFNGQIFDLSNGSDLSFLEGTGIDLNNPLLQDVLNDEIHHYVGFEENGVVTHTYPSDVTPELRKQHLDALRKVAEEQRRKHNHRQ